MDISILSAYVGMRKFRVKKHLKPSPFRRLSKEKLEKYAKAFDISVEALLAIDPERD